MSTNSERFHFAMLIFFVIILLWLITTPVKSQTAAPYMLVYTESQGLYFFCLDENPFELETPQSEPEIETLVSRLGHQTSTALGFEVDECNMDAFYYDENDQAYVWRFEDDNDIHGNPAHRHMTRGAYWINWLRLDGVHMGQ